MNKNPPPNPHNYLYHQSIPGEKYPEPQGRVISWLTYGQTQSSIEKKSILTDTGNCDETNAKKSTQSRQRF